MSQPPTRLPRPWDSPGKNTGVGCHFLLQCMKVKSESAVAQLCPTLSYPMDCSLPGSSVPGIFQAGVLEWDAIAFSDCKPESEVTQSCPTLCDPVDCSLPGSSVHGIFQTWIPEWVAIAFSDCKPIWPYVWLEFKEEEMWGWRAWRLRRKETKFGASLYEGEDEMHLRSKIEN